MEFLFDPSICDIPNSKKKSLFSAFPLPKASESHNDCLTQIISLAETTLFTWSSFRVKLPPSLLFKDNDEKFNTISYRESNADSYKPSVKYIFDQQDFDEWGYLARGNCKNSLRLDNSQLHQIREYGQFSVQSRSFPGHSHTWKISNILQRGRIPILKSLQFDLRGAFELLIISARNRFFGDFFSVEMSAYALLDFVKMISDLFFGWPHVHRDARRLLEEERLNFLTNELSVTVSNRHSLNDFWNFLEKASRQPKNINTDKKIRYPSPPYSFVTSSKLPIDLRLHNNSLLEKCLVVINELRHFARENWFDEFKRELFDSLKDCGKSVEEIRSIIREDALKEYASRLFSAIRQSEKLNNIDPSIAEILIQQASFNLAVLEAKSTFAESWLSTKSSLTQNMMVHHPILWSIPKYRKRCIDTEKKMFIESRRLDVHRLVLSKCISLNLKQFEYFVRRDIQFLTEREPLLLHELENTAFIPDNIFEYNVKSRIPLFWKVFRKNDLLPEREELVSPTMWTDSRNSCQIDISTPLLANGDPINPLFPGQTNRKIQYRLVDNWKLKSSSSFFFWRWLAFLIYTLVLVIEGCQLFLYTIPFKSPVSITAVFRKRPIYFKAELDPNTGFLSYSNHPRVKTLCGRIKSRWQSAHSTANSYIDLERMGKNRFLCLLARFFIYSILAFIPSVLIVAFLAPLCVLISFISIFVGIATPLLAPICCASVHLLGIVFLDVYKPVSNPNRWFPIFEAIIWHLGIRCILQSILALLTGLLILPLATAIITVTALLQWSSRTVWDFLVFHLVLRRFLHMPARDNNFIKRLSGPGLSPTDFHKIRLVDVCIVLASRLENLELIEWQAQMEILANEPLTAYTTLANNLSWLSLSLVETGIFSQLVEQTRKWMEEIDAKANERRSELEIKFSQFQASRVKMCGHELQKLVGIGGHFTQTFFENRILPRLRLLNRSPSEWWLKRGLCNDDYSGLCMQLLRDKFGEQFLVSLKDTDTVFPLHSREVVISERFNTWLLLVRPQTKIDSIPRKINTEEIICNVNSIPTRCPYPGRNTFPSMARNQATVLCMRSMTVNNPPKISSSSNQMSVDVDEASWASRSHSWRETVILVKPEPPSDSVLQPVLFESFGNPLPSVDTSVVPILNSESRDSCEIAMSMHPIMDLPLFPLSVFLPNNSHISTPLRTSTSWNAGKSFCTVQQTLFSLVWKKLQNIASTFQRCFGLHSPPVISQQILLTSNNHEGIGTILLKEPLDRILSTLPLENNVNTSKISKFTAPDPGENKQHFAKSWIRKFITRTLSRKWNLITEQRAGPIPLSDVIFNVGRVAHPAIIALLMHARIVEENMIDTEHPLIQRTLMHFSTFPAQKQKGIGANNSQTKYISPYFKGKSLQNHHHNFEKQLTLSVIGSKHLIRSLTRSLEYRLVFSPSSVFRKQNEVPFCSIQKRRSRSVMIKPCSKTSLAENFNETADHEHASEELPTNATWNNCTDFSNVGKWEDFSLNDWWKTEAKNEHLTALLGLDYEATETNTSVYDTEDNGTTDDCNDSQSFPDSIDIISTYDFFRIAGVHFPNSLSSQAYHAGGSLTKSVSTAEDGTHVQPFHSLCETDFSKHSVDYNQSRL